MNTYIDCEQSVREERTLRAAILKAVLKKTGKNLGLQRDESTTSALL